MTYRTPPRRLSITEIISKSANLYVARFELFLLPFLITSLVSNAVGYFIWELLPDIVVPPDFTEEFALWVLDYLALIIPIVAVTLFIGWLLTAIASGIAVKASADMLEGRQASLRTGLNLTFSRLSALLAAGFLTGSLVVLGLVLLVIPGIIVAIMFSLTVPVIMLENLGSIDGLRRSRKLVAGKWWKTFVILLFVGVLVVAVNMVGGIIGSAFARNNDVLRVLIVGLISALAQPLEPIALTYLYYTLRIEEKAAEPRLPVQPTYPVAPVPTPWAKQPYQPKFCYKCGQSLPSDAVYCPRCGVSVKTR
jgi:hypothetical protein